MYARIYNLIFTKTMNLILFYFNKAHITYILFIPLIYNNTKNVIKILETFLLAAIYSSIVSNIPLILEWLGCF